MGIEVGRIIIVKLLWSEIMGGNNTPGTMVEIVKVGHEIIINLHDYMTSNKCMYMGVVVDS